MHDSNISIEHQEMFADAIENSVAVLMPVVATLGCEGRLGRDTQGVVVLLSTACILNQALAHPASLELLGGILEVCNKLAPRALQVYYEEFVDTDETADVEGN